MKSREESEKGKKEGQKKRIGCHLNSRLAYRLSVCLSVWSNRSSIRSISHEQKGPIVFRVGPMPIDSSWHKDVPFPYQVTTVKCRLSIQSKAMGFLRSLSSGRGISEEPCCARLNIQNPRRQFSGHLDRCVLLVELTFPSFGEDSLCQVLGRWRCNKELDSWRLGDNPSL